jgi:hypothetical protein
MMDTKTLEKEVVLIGAILGGCRSRDKLSDVMYDIICFNRCVTATQCCPWTSVPLISWLGDKNPQTANRTDKLSSCRPTGTPDESDHRRVEGGIEAGGCSLKAL